MNPTAHRPATIAGMPRLFAILLGLVFLFALFAPLLGCATGRAGAGEATTDSHQQAAIWNQAGGSVSTVNFWLLLPSEAAGDPERAAEAIAAIKARQDYYRALLGCLNPSNVMTVNPSTSGVTQTQTPTATTTTSPTIPVNVAPGSGSPLPGATGAPPGGGSTPPR